MFVNRALNTSVLLHCLATVFPDYTVSAELAVQFRVRAGQRICQTFPAVPVFVLFTIKYGFFLWMKAAVMFVDHGESRLNEKLSAVKVT